MRRLLLPVLAMLTVWIDQAPAQVASPAFDAPEVLFRGYGLIDGDVPAGPAGAAEAGAAAVGARAATRVGAPGGAPSGAPGGASVGVPLGGIGTGRLDFCADGGFRNLTLGPVTTPLARHEGALFELVAERGPRAGAGVSGGSPTGLPALHRALVAGGAGGLAGVDHLDFRGLFPRAFLRGTDEALGFVTEVEAFAPLVPHDVEASTWPAIGFRVTLRETAGEPVRATVVLHVPSRPDFAVLHALAAEARPGVTVTDGDGSVAVSVQLPAGGEAEVFLALAWSVHDHPAAARWPDASATAADFVAHWRALHAATRRWQELLFTSGLPRWYAERLVNDLAPLVTNTRLSPDGVLATAEGATGLEGITGTLDQRRVAHVMTQAFFPQLDLSELSVFAARQDARGRVPHHVGTLADGPLPPDMGFLDWPDLACSFTLQVLKTWLWTGDREATAAFMPHVAAALGWLAAMDTDGDGIPEGGSTFDYGTPLPGFSYTATMTLAAYEAGARLGADFGDAELVRTCTANAARTRDALVTRLWNGRWFVRGIDGSASGGGAGSFLCQLAGEWTARAFGLGPLLPESLVRRAADSLVARHGAASPWIPPLEVDEDGRLGSARWGWLPYTYTDYASLLIQLDLADAAWVALRNLDRMLVEQVGDPFKIGLYYDSTSGARLRSNYDWYMSAPASWWTLYASAGFGLDLPRGTLTLAPSLPGSMRHAALPLFAPTFTAVCVVDDTAWGVERSFELRMLELHGDPVVLRRLATRVPLTATGRPVTCTLEWNGAPIAADVSLSGRDLLAELSQPLTLSAGSMLRVRLMEPQSREVGASVERALEASTHVLADDTLRAELELGPRGLARITLRDDLGHEVRADVNDLFQFLVTSPSGARLDVRTDPGWSRRVHVAEVTVKRADDDPAAPCLLQHVVQLHDKAGSTSFERFEVDVELALVPSRAALRCRLRARSPSLAAARTAVVRFPCIAFVDPGTVGEAIVAEWSPQPGVELTDPAHMPEVTTDWIDAATPLWAIVSGPRGALELRSEATRAPRCLRAGGDGYAAVRLSLLSAAAGTRTAGAPRGDEDAFGAGWDVVAEAQLGLR